MMTWIDRLIWMRHLIASSAPGWIFDAELENARLQQQAGEIDCNLGTLVWALGKYTVAGTPGEYDSAGVPLWTLKVIL